MKLKEIKLGIYDGIEYRILKSDYYLLLESRVAGNERWETCDEIASNVAKKNKGPEYVKASEQF